MTSNDQSPEPPSYRFGPAEPRTVLLGADAAQLGLVLAGIAASLVAVNLLPSQLAPLAVLPLVGSLLVAFVPVRGAAAIDHLRLACAFRIDGARGRLRWRSPAPTRGRHAGVEESDSSTGWLDTPPAWGRLRVDAAAHADAAIGILYDESTKTVSGVVRVRSDAFDLLADDEQQRRAESWGALLASLAREDHRVHRLSIIERTHPAIGDDEARWLAAERDQAAPLTAASIADYISLVDHAVRQARDHETLLTLQISLAERRADIDRHIRSGATRDEAVGHVVIGDLLLVAQTIQDAAIGRVDALTPRGLAAHLRTASDPAARPTLARLAAAGNPDGCAPATAGPLAVDAHWSCVQTDSGWHATYWIARWPHRDVPLLFLAPLLTRTAATRAVAITLEPLSPSRARREAEHAVTREEADATTRAKHGFLETARSRGRRHGVADQETELAVGYALCRYTAHLTVAAPTPTELDASCAEVEHLAHQAGLELRLLAGDQARALTYTLPGLCRGLA